MCSLTRSKAAVPVVTVRAADVNAIAQPYFEIMSLLAPINDCGLIQRSVRQTLNL